MILFRTVFAVKPEGLTGFSAAILGLFAAAIVGCGRPPSTPTAESLPPAPTAEEILDARIQYEIADIRARALLPPEASRDPGADQRDLEESLRTIGMLADREERNRRLENLAGRLIVANRFFDAAGVVEQLDDPRTKDSLLEDIVRLQMKEAHQTFQHVRRYTPGGKMPEEIAELIRHAAEMSRKIVDPLHRAEAFGNIALFRWNMNDRDGAVEMIQKAAESLRTLDDDIRKARGLCYLARWLLRHDDAEKTYQYCKEAEVAAVHLTDPMEATGFFLDLSSLYTLLDKNREAKFACDEASAFVSEISNPREKADALLRLAETSLVTQMREKEGSTAKKLLYAKSIVLEAAEMIEQRSVAQPNPMAATNPRPEIFAPISLDPYEKPAAVTALSWEELASLKNDILVKIAAMQVWGAPLEDVWETIQDIDDLKKRDEAILEAIKMMIVVRNKEDAEAWADEIDDPEQREKIMEELRAESVE